MRAQMSEISGHVPLALAFFFQKFTFSCPGLRFLWGFKARKHPLLIPLITDLPGGEHCITGILCSLLLNLFFKGSGLISLFFFLTQYGIFLLEH